MPTLKESEVEIKYRPCKYEFGANKISSVRSEIRINEEVLLGVAGEREPLLQIILSQKDQ